MALRRKLLLLASLAAGGLVMVILVGFAWPEDAPPRVPDSMNLGPVDQYEIGSVTMLRGPAGATQDRWPVRPALVATLGRSVADSPVVLALARYDDGSFGAFLARDTFSGCTLPWRDTFQLAGETGWFRDPCHGATYDEHGVGVDGPAPRNMDYCDVEVNEAGDVVVDLRVLHEGERRRGGVSVPNIEGWSAR
jgi:Rieske Fe-S protein